MLIAEALAADPAGLLPARQQMALPLVLVSAAAGVGTILLLIARRFAAARATAVAAVAAVVSGWGVGQYPWLLVDELRIADAAGAEATLVGLLVASALATVIVIPALAYLYRLTQSPAWSER